ncbi:hypothetical protein ACJH6J_06760 [Mycobacterium sp. SMC-18]|uniref:Hemophore-related protein n=1 Tax=Mycolicibacterium mucogenicum TaxID=56689 RepID=A0A4V3AWH7_MYCMU|nr:MULTISPECIES: hypothetical protein [Mycolicibacterium]MDX1878550.1 hypothetical protein [Mycolicibacterium sp. 141076]TDK90598.1 hypothetical protein EUA03_09290 [Mycolicibacterium mucogenicum]BCI79352.1 hypothetical protein MTY66_09770 [Mycolicibacterium sp. TY66]BCJ82987.1 hypothetical protein MTY81_43600 [Mycolicibacterium sp. TY81]GCA98908.1 hypothetical protein NCCNTM_25430 [Mycolicibacterium sp. NCC-Tsukiji]
MLFATTARLVCTVATAATLAVAGCGTAGHSSNSSAGTAGATAAAGNSGAGDFCTLDAKLVARKLRDMNSAFGSGAANQSQIVDDLLKDAPVTQGELIAAAPAEPHRYLEDLADPNKMDAMLDNMKALNDWALKNCDAKYRPLFEEHGKLVG